MNKWTMYYVKSEWLISDGPKGKSGPGVTDKRVLVEKVELDTALEALKQTINGLKNQLEPHVFEGLPYKVWRENVLSQLAKAELYLHEKIAEDVVTQMRGNC